MFLFLIIIIVQLISWYRYTSVIDRRMDYYSAATIWLFKYEIWDKICASYVAAYRRGRSWILNLGALNACSPVFQTVHRYIFYACAVWSAASGPCSVQGPVFRDWLVAVTYGRKIPTWHVKHAAVALRSLWVVQLWVVQAQHPRLTYSRCPTVDHPRSLEH